MAERWPVVPELLAERTASAPRRLLRKLDRQPDVADKWLWEGVSVTTDKGETVSLSLDQGRVTHATCTCLLSPRCLHVLGVLRALPVADETAEVAPEDQAYPLWVSLVAMGVVVALVPISLMYGELVGPWIVPLMVVGFLTAGVANGVPVYEVFVEGAREGWEVAVKLIPYLVAILCAVGMLRGSGAIDAFVAMVGPVTGAVGLPAEALPMAMLRPLSGSGAYGVMMATMTEHGPDSYVGYVVSTLQGSTETTFYVLAVYFGAVQVQRIRHAMAAALTADMVGVAAAVAAVAAYFRYNGLG